MILRDTTNRSGKKHTAAPREGEVLICEIPDNFNPKTPPMPSPESDLPCSSRPDASCRAGWWRGRGGKSCRARRPPCHEPSLANATWRHSGSPLAACRHPALWGRHARESAPTDAAVRGRSAARVRPVGTGARCPGVRSARRLQAPVLARIAGRFDAQR